LQRILASICALVMLGLASAKPSAADVVQRYSVNSGGTPISSSTLRIDGSVGQAVAGFANSADYNLWLGLWDAQASNLYAVATIEAAKLLPDGSLVCLSGKVASTSGSSFPGFVYIEEPDWSYGLRVRTHGPVGGLHPGDLIGAVGLMSTNSDDERELLSITLTGGPRTQIDPVGLYNCDVGGSDWSYNPVSHVGQRGIASACGPNNIGLLITTSGTVTEVGSDYFIVDDLSRCDGQTSGQLRLRVPQGVSSPKRLSFVLVNGISSCLRVGPDLSPVVLLRSQEDVRVLSVPEPRNIAEAKGIGDGISFGLTGKKVTAVFSGCFYVSETDRSAGIRVVSTHAVNEGDIVTLTGALRATDGEREFVATSVDAVGSPALLAPLGVSSRTLGGGAMWLQSGVYEGAGVSNIGLPVRMWGRVTQIDSGAGYYYLHDGSSFRDGTTTQTSPGVFEDNVGVRVIGNPAGLGSGSYIAVTAISSCFTNSSGLLQRKVLEMGREVILAGP
jgi:hypothetical protein